MAKSSTITPEQAQAELHRRSLPKNSAERKVNQRQAILDGTFSIPNGDLKVIAGVPKKARKTTATKKAEAQVVDHELKLAAKQAFDTAFAAAEEGSKMRAGRTAYGRILRGESLADVLASITA